MCAYGVGADDVGGSGATAALCTGSSLVVVATGEEVVVAGVVADVELGSNDALPMGVVEGETSVVLGSELLGDAEEVPPA